MGAFDDAVRAEVDKLYPSLRYQHAEDVRRFMRLDPDMPAPPLDGGDWGFEPYEDVLDLSVAEASDLGDGAE